MVNRKANIDLLFRNGLKDFEVLPPPEVWSNIKPVIRKKQTLYIFIRTAAAIALLLSISFLAYRLGRENPTFVQYPGIAFNTGSELTTENGAIFTAESETGNNIQSPVLKNKNLPPVQPADIPVPEDEVIIRQNTGFIARLNSLLPGNRSDEETKNLVIRSKKRNNDYVPEFNDLTEQDYLTVTDRQVKDRWSITAMASPTYYPNPQVLTDELSKQISSSEQAQISYSGGVGFAYKISKKLSVQSGLYYSSIGQEVGNIYSFGGFGQFIYTKSDRNFEVLTSTGRIYTENPDIFLRDGIGDRVLTRYTNDVFDPAKASLQYMGSSLYQNFSYIEMPVILRYKLLDKNIDINLIGGLSYNMLVNNSVYARFDGDKLNIGKTDGLSPFLISSSVGMGMEYNLSEKFSLNLEPTFRYYMNPFNDVSGIKAHPYSFGLFSGLSYKF